MLIDKIVDYKVIILIKIINLGGRGVKLSFLKFLKVDFLSIGFLF